MLRAVVALPIPPMLSEENILYHAVLFFCEKSGMIKKKDGAPEGAVEVIFLNVMIASDIHGSSYYCGQLTAAFAREGAERLLLLGDLLYHGPRNDLPQGYAPKEVIGQLNALCDRILCVRGNCEAEVDQMVLDFPVLADYAILYAGGHMIFATHGHLFHENHVPPLQKGDILLHGHTHIPACRTQGSYLYINPGSVSIPKENTPRSYMLLNDAGFTWKTLEGRVYGRYDFEKGGGLF